MFFFDFLVLRRRFDEEAVDEDEVGEDEVDEDEVDEDGVDEVGVDEDETGEDEVGEDGVGDEDVGDEPDGCVDAIWRLILVAYSMAAMSAFASATFAASRATVKSFRNF